MSSFPELLSDRLRLRQFTDADLPNVYEGLSDPEVIKYYGVSFKTLDETKEQMTWFADLELSGTGIWWAITSKHDGAFYGGAGLNDISKEHRKAEIGMWLLPKYWGNGILSETMPLVFNYAFEQIKLHRIEGFVENTNEKCKKAIRKVGLEYEGTMKDCEFKNGQFIDVDIYARLNKVH